MFTAAQITLDGVPAYPIWRDIIYSTQGTGFAELDVVDYAIIVNGNTLFSGRAAKRPGDSYIQIRLNDILAGLLRQSETGSFPIAKTGNTAYGRVFWGVARSFAVSISDPDNVIATEVEDAEVFADWSGDRGKDYTFPELVEGARNQFQNAYMGALVSPVADPRQYVVASTMKGTHFTVYKLIAGSGGSQWFNPVFDYENTSYVEDLRVFAVKASDMNDAWAENGGLPFYFFRINWNDGEHQTDLNLYNGNHAYGQHDRFDFNIQSTCARYCLYYLNAYGGWDWLLIRGKAVETRKITRSSIERRPSTDLLFDRIQRRGNDVIDQTDVKHLELHTHWLTDDEASRMWHLTGSPDVYVHDLEAGVVYPAVLTGTTHQEKTYKGQGNKLVQYTIDMDFAVESRRR